MSTKLRVIAGAYRGQKLYAPRGLRTRPTGARVREALFSILGNLDGARVLDLFAGSGALSIEALSRGAASAVLVEHDRAALHCIRQNVEELALSSRVRVLPVRVSGVWPSLGSEGFDLVLCDPPWDALRGALSLLAELAARSLLAPDARIVLEHAARDGVPEVPGLTAYDRRTWGDTCMSFFTKAPSAAPADSQPARSAAADEHEAGESE